MADRAYLPDRDFSEYLEKNNLPLFSLEEQRPLGDFDVLAFNLSSELTLTNVLKILELGRIPLFRGERKAAPLILAGGPLTLNPLPFQEFFDLIFIGEGEEFIKKTSEIFPSLKAASKENILSELSKLSGTFLPGGKKEIKKQSVDLDRWLYPKRRLVPLVDVSHNRLSIEVMRGCAGRCRFCQSKLYYFPCRFRKKENILALIEENLKKTGFEEVALGGLNVTLHPEIEELVSELVGRFKKKRIALSL
ncbi:MAG TPA: radical SAM protein, partial [bacterium]|nr:radical SAM protein [bacterium]